MYSCLTSKMKYVDIIIYKFYMPRQTRLSRIILYPRYLWLLKISMGLQHVSANRVDTFELFLRVGLTANQGLARWFLYDIRASPSQVINRVTGRTWIGCSPDTKRGLEVSWCLFQPVCVGSSYLSPKKS